MGSDTVRNVLVIMTDQHRYTAGRWLGDPWVRTPRLDALAAGGTVFERCYTPSPVCVPARQSLLTGRLPHVHGAVGNGAPMRPGERTIAHVAQGAGFATGAVGKMHFIGADQHQGFAERWDIAQYAALEPEASGDAASGMAAPGCYGRYVPGREGSVPDGPNPMLIRHGNYDARPSPFPAARHVEAYTTREAVRFLERHRHERWMLWCSYWKPHAPYTPPQEDWDAYAGRPFVVPAVDDELLSGLPAHLRAFRERTGVGRIGEEGMRRCIAGYYGSVGFIDRLAGEVLGALEALGLLDETLVIFVSDHGEMLGEHGLLAKSNFYEAAWRVPLIVSHPAYRGAGRRTARTAALACLTDLCPTIAECAGLVMPENRVPTNGVPTNGAPESVHGHSLLPIISGTQAPARDHVFSELHYPGGPFYGLYDGEWKLALYAGEDQLFHLPSDPAERHNLIAEAPDEAARLRDRLVADAGPQA